MKLYIKSFNEAITSQRYIKMHFYNITYSENNFKNISSFIGKISIYNNGKRSLSNNKIRSKYYKMCVIQALMHNEGIKRISEAFNDRKN